MIINKQLSNLILNDDMIRWHNICVCMGLLIDWSKRDKETIFICFVPASQQQYGVFFSFYSMYMHHPLPPTVGKKLSTYKSANT